MVVPQYDHGWSDDQSGISDEEWSGIRDILGRPLATGPRRNRGPPASSHGVHGDSDEGEGDDRSTGFQWECSGTGH